MQPAWPAAGADEKRWAWALLAGAMVLAGVWILWLGRGMTFWGDELAWMLESPHLSLNGALQPHEGHLVLTTHLVYKALFELFGTAYLPFRLLTLATILLTVSLFFALAARRVGALLALAPSLLLLVFSGDALHVLLGNGFTILFAVSCGLGALLLIESGSRRTDLGACVLLCIGVATYSIALAFVVGVAAAIVLSGGRSRLWVVAVPALLYAAWWLWAPASGENHGSLANMLLLPAWGFQSLGAILAALSGLEFSFSTTSPPATVGPALAVLALSALAWRFRARRIPPAVWVAATVLLGLWLLQVLVSSRNGGRLPDESRYMYPGAIAVLLVVTAAAADLRLSRRGAYALVGVTLACVAVNVSVLRDRATELRNVDSVQTRAALTGLELAHGQIAPKFLPPPPDFDLPLLGHQSPLGVPFTALPAGRSAATDFPAAIERYGRLGYTPQELVAKGEPAGAEADSVLAGALALQLAEAPPGLREGRPCVAVASGIGTNPTARLPRGGAALRAGPDGAEVQIRRFASGVAVPLGALQPHGLAALRIPPDGVATPWRIYVPSGRLTACPLS